MFRQLENAGLADLHFASDPETGLRAIVAIHSTKRGPAIGGCRFIEYASDDEAITDAIRLARGMSYKAALADLPHGGGKAVVLKPAGNFDRSALMQSFGRFVDSLGGRYITAMDSGTQVTDMDAIATQTRWVSCTSQAGDPSPYTAQGVFEGICAAVHHRLERDRLTGVRIALQGLGHVGLALARQLHAAGAQLLVSDLDRTRVGQAVQAFGARALAPEEIYAAPADVFCPCGLGAIINDDSIAQLNCAIVAGSANNQLAEARHGELLRQRGILYAPDYLINAGGLIFVALHHAGAPASAIAAKVQGIGNQLTALFEQADREGRPTSEVADSRAEAIIARAGRHAGQHPLETL
ncbi:leucine dehydrogenase [Marinobacterium nitratireducens]|uniref:Leucine dehydrogenase n=1 Tax=Marinobacterium nitratireducens TaxID=518897 RepID=A0A917ZHQ9_9GAMM|nr:amino acid dehydrogenase [Marinobacterium nitratireducens]GGO82339.1 leucine dehydrogenase [Marinobacterium nitratireducens]